MNNLLVLLSLGFTALSLARCRWRRCCSMGFWAADTSRLLKFCRWD